MQVEAPFSADGQALELVQQREGLLDNEQAAVPRSRIPAFAPRRVLG
ncbi:hypothetical protein [Streptomyces olivoreticuli]|nr:hypothetical protein [Streptomyces olivoreticuli]